MMKLWDQMDGVPWRREIFDGPAGKILRFDARFGRKALENDVSDVESPEKNPPAAAKKKRRTSRTTNFPNTILKSQNRKATNFPNDELPEHLLYLYVYLIAEPSESLIAACIATRPHSRDLEIPVKLLLLIVEKWHLLLPWNPGDVSEAWVTEWAPYLA